MSASPDWVGMERVISESIPASGIAARAQLLARLAYYSKAAIREARTLGAMEPSPTQCTQAVEWLLRPVLICGHHRSGTTLLQNLLDGHPDLLSLPSEGTYFTSFAYVARRGSSSRDLDRFAAEWVMRLIDPNFEPHFRLGYSDAARNPAVEFARRLFGWNTALKHRVPEEFAPLLALAAAFKGTTAPNRSVQRWVEKTPRNERHVGRFAFFEAARFVQLVRDPSATLASLDETYRSADIRGFDAAAYACTIGQSLCLAQANSRRLGDRYLVVRYEDLVNQPVPQIERVRQFLDISSDAMLQIPTAGGTPVRPNSSFANGAAGVIERSRPHVGPPTEHATLLAVYAADQARCFGYEMASASRLQRVAIRIRHWPRHALHGALTYLRATRARGRARDRKVGRPTS